MGLIVTYTGVAPKVNHLVKYKLNKNMQVIYYDDQDMHCTLVGPDH
jgi:hypothetical protein